MLTIYRWSRKILGITDTPEPEFTKKWRYCTDVPVTPTSCNSRISTKEKKSKCSCFPFIFTFPTRALLHFFLPKLHFHWYCDFMYFASHGLPDCFDFRFYLVFEMMRGGALIDHIEKRRTFNERQASTVLYCITSALQHLHSAGNDQAACRWHVEEFYENSC